MQRPVRAVSALFIAAMFTAAGASGALAGGLSQEDLDPLALLHVDRAFVAEASGFVRQPTNGRTGARNGYGWRGNATSGADPSGKSGAVTLKARAGAGDCLLRVHQPWARWERRDPQWAAANDFAESRLESAALDAACSWRFDMGGSARLRAIAGLRAGGLEMYHQIGLPAHLVFHLKSRDVGLGWRAGLSWEDPSVGLRISALYTAPMAFAVSGSQWFNGANAGTTLTADIEMPQSLALRFERDVAPGWRGALDAQWTEWSAFDDLRIKGATLMNGIGDAVLSTGFDDAVTLKAELEHDLTADWRAAASLRWDQGVSGAVPDLWTLGASVARSFGDHVELELNAALGWRMAGAASGVDSITGRSWSYRSEAGPVYGAGMRITLAF